MFQEERDEIEAQTKIVDIFRDIHDILQGSLSMHDPQRSANESVPMTRRQRKEDLNKSFQIKEILKMP